MADKPDDDKLIPSEQDTPLTTDQTPGEDLNETFEVPAEVIQDGHNIPTTDPNNPKT